MASIRYAFLVALFAFSAHAQFGSNATKLRNSNLCNPLTLTDASALTWDATNGCWNGAATAGVQVSTQPLNQRDTCSGTIVANTLVMASSGTILAHTLLNPVLGIARAGCVGTGVTTIAMVGSESCVAEGAIAAGRWLIPGTTNAARCKDSGTADISGIPNTTPVVGLSRGTAADAANVEVTLFGSGQYGLDDGGAGGGSGDFSSNTSTSVDGEVVEMSGTGGKTGKRSNRTHAVAAISAGVIGAATAAGVVGLFTGDPDGTLFLKDDGTLGAAGGGESLTAGTGLVRAGDVFLLDSASQRTNITASATIDFSSLAAPPSATACRVSTITVTGAAVGDAVKPIWPNALNDLVTGRMSVTAADTVTVQVCYLGTSTHDPASLTYGATVEKVF